MNFYYQPDIFLVCGMPHNGKTRFSVGYSQEKSNIVVVHIDTIFVSMLSGFTEDEDIKQSFNIYGYVQHTSFDKELFFSHLKERLTETFRQNSYKKTIILEGYVCGILFDEIKRIILEQYTIKNVYKVEMVKTHIGYETIFENTSMGISTNFDYLHIIKNIDTYLIDKTETTKRNTYQKFPWSKETEVNSNSDIKLAASFGNDNIFGKTFLDIGCNSGFFCFQARQKGACKVMGIDAGENWISHAYDINKYFYNMGDIHFMCASIMDFIAEHKFDIVFCASVFHYFKEKQKFVLEKIRNMMEPNGVLYLEVEISPEINVDVDYAIRGQDSETLAYPTKEGFSRMINTLYNIEAETPSYRQPGCLYDRFFYKLRCI